MAKRKTTTKEATDLKRCECGCGVVVTKRFAMGHDQRHKGALLRAFDGGNSEAGDELVERGWRTANELEERRAKAETKAQMLAEREAAKAEKASAKAAKAEAEPEPAQPKVSRDQSRRSNRSPMVHVGNVAS